MKIQKLASLSSAERAEILARGGEVSAEIKTGVAEILKEVETRGAAAVLEFTQKFDGVVGSQDLEASADELAAVDESAAEFDFLRQAAANIEKFHQNQLQYEHEHPLLINGAMATAFFQLDYGILDYLK